MTQIEAIDKMIALIDSGWTKFSNAKDDKGVSVHATDPTATCWCLDGALLKVHGLNFWSDIPGLREARLLRIELLADLPAKQLTTFNDHFAPDKVAVIQQLQMTKNRLAEAVA